MKFKFAYENLLKHKKRLEEIAAKEFAEAQHQVAEANAELKRMYGLIDDARLRSLELESEGGQKGHVLVQIGEFILGQKKRIEGQSRVVRSLMMEAERRQEALMEAAREYKTLEKLREKRFKEFRDLVKKHELKVVDELVTTRFKRGGII